MTNPTPPARPIRRVCIVGASGNLGQYMVEHCLARGYEVVGVSCDSFAVHRAWADAMGLEHTLLADMHRSVCRAFGFYWPELNIASRGTVVIEKEEADGEVIARVRWSQARKPSQAMDIDEIFAHLG